MNEIYMLPSREPVSAPDHPEGCAYLGLLWVGREQKHWWVIVDGCTRQHGDPFHTPPANQEDGRQ